MDSSKVEIEAKFIIPDSVTFAGLKDLRQLDNFELKPIGTKTVVDQYLDSADRSLYQSGLACRLRKVNNKQIITLKALTKATSEIHHRQEVEVVIKSDNLQMGQPYTWPDNEAKEMVIEIVGAATLQPMFTLYQTRHQFQVLWEGQTVIEFSLDEVSLREKAQVDYRELEAELIEAGNEAVLNLFVAALQARWPLEAEAQSKFERALALTR